MVDISLTPGRVASTKKGSRKTRAAIRCLTNLLRILQQSRSTSQQISLAIHLMMATFPMVVTYLRRLSRRKRHFFVSFRAPPRSCRRRHHRLVLHLLFLPCRQHLYPVRGNRHAVLSLSNGPMAHLSGLHRTNPQTRLHPYPGRIGLPSRHRRSSGLLPGH
jgi:hypothetical protein